MTSGRNLCRHARAIAIAAVVIALPVLSGCGKDKPMPQKPVVPVTAATAAGKDVPYEIRAIGTIEAYSDVSVKAQVTGQLTKIHIREGQFVGKGTLLFTIDPRQQQAAVQQAEAALTRDIAQVENAREEERRYAELLKKGYVSRQQYDQIRTNAAALEATVAAGRSNVEAAKTQLSYYFIHSPINGRVGDLLVDQGNLVKANDDTRSLAVIKQIEPISVSFAVPEQHLSPIRQYMAKQQLAVEVFIDKNDSKPERGVLTFIDNAVDPATGTIKLKGTIKNSGHRLWPGQFVTAVLTLFTQKEATVVPSQAVMTGQSGQFVYAIKDDGSAEPRPVVVSRTYGADSVIEKGLAPGDRVVTDGQLRLVPGAQVKIQEGLKPPAPEPPQAAPKK